MHRPVAVNTGLKTQNVENLSLYLIFTDIFCQNIKSFCKQNSILKIRSKPTEFIQNRTEIDFFKQQNPI